jgi:hypothetical protein
MFTSIMFLSGVLLAQPGGGADAALAAKVGALVSRLDADSKADRDAAEQDLTRLGPPILALLPKSVDPSKPETKERLARVRQKLELADAASTVDASRFRFELVGVEASTQSLRVRVKLAWKLQIAPIMFLERMADVRATDGQGKPLAVESPDAVEEIPAPPKAIAAPLEIRLAAPPRDTKKIAKLQGTITAIVSGRIETFEFKSLPDAKNAKKRVAGVSVTLQEVRQSGPLWEVHLLVRYDQTHGALASHRSGWIFANPAMLEGPDGKSLVYERYETSRQTDNEVGVVYFFKPPRPIGDYAFVYKTPGLILSLPLRYEFEGIKLP